MLKKKRNLNQNKFSAIRLTFTVPYFLLNQEKFPLFPSCKKLPSDPRFITEVNDKCWVSGCGFISKFNHSFRLLLLGAVSPFFHLSVRGPERASLIRKLFQNVN